MSKVSSAVKNLLVDLTTLQRPVTAAAVVAVVVELLPGVHINGTVVAGILVGVGVVAGFVENLLSSPTPVPVPPPAPTPPPAPVAAKPRKKSV